MRATSNLTRRDHMATKKKSTPRTKPKKAAAKRATQSIRAMKGSVLVQGNITAKRDVIMGDQYNDFRQQVAQIASPQEFVTELGKLHSQIAALKQVPEITPAQAQTIEVVEGQVKEVIEEAKKPQPLGARITATLTGARAVMDSMVGGVASAAGLGATLPPSGRLP